MTAPDTIYIPADDPRFSWRSIRQNESDIAYVRKLTRYQIETLAFGDDGIENDFLIPNLWDLCQRQRVELAKLNKAVEAQKAEIAALASDCNALSLLNQDCKAEIARLRDALEHHGIHHGNCDSERSCTCGFTAALKGE